MRAKNRRDQQDISGRLPADSYPVTLTGRLRLGYVKPVVSL